MWGIVKEAQFYLMLSRILSQELHDLGMEEVRKKQIGLSEDFKWTNHNMDSIKNFTYKILGTPCPRDPLKWTISIPIAPCTSPTQTPNPQLAPYACSKR